MFDKKASGQYPINDLLARRWSGRAYDPARPVPRDRLLSLLEAARWAPSCFGDEPWRFIVCDRAANEADWQRALDCLTEKNRSWARRAPVLMIISAATVFARSGKPNKWGPYDCGAAAMSLCVQATAHGLMVHQMAGFDPAQASAGFGIPAEFRPMAMLTVGYQLPPDEVPEDLREREFAERRRRPLGESCFEGGWGKPII